MYVIFFDTILVFFIFYPTKRVCIFIPLLTYSHTIYYVLIFISYINLNICNTLTAVLINKYIYILKMLEHINLNSERINQTDVYIYIRLRIIVLHGNGKKKRIHLRNRSNCICLSSTKNHIKSRTV